MGIWDELKAVALAVHRLTEAEKKMAEMAAENRAAVKELRALLQDMRDRQLRLEGRMDSLDEIASSKAQGMAALAVANALGPMMERLARLEVGDRPRSTSRAARLPPPPAENDA